MAYRTGKTSDDLHGPVLTRNLVDAPQSVTVSIHGFVVSGEVIFADLWQTWFGETLPERVMFRLVLLSQSQRVDPSDITDHAIMVAVPAPERSKQDADEVTQMHREVARLHEIRERYLATSDKGLQHLAASLTQKVSEANSQITRAHVEQWRKGNIVISSGNHVSVSPDGVFVGDDPRAWVEAVAAAIFANYTKYAHTRSGSTELAEPEDIFTALAEDRQSTWRTGIERHLLNFTDSDLEQILAGLSTLLTDRGGIIIGEEIRTYMLKEIGLPPGLAWLCLMAFVRALDGEVAISLNDHHDTRLLNAYTLSSFSYLQDMIYLVDFLRDSPSSDWSTVLPYIRVFVPYAQDAPTSPTPSQEAQLMRALETNESRLSLAVHTLRSAVGRSINSISSFQSTEKLIEVLKARNWQEFLVLATTAFPDAKQFTEAVQQATRLRTLAEDILDVRAASEYVSMADFGRADHALGSEAELLKVRLDINEIVDVSVPALSILHDFQQWRRRYSSVYRTFHAEKRHANQLLSREIRSASVRFDALRKLVALPVLKMAIPAAFEAQWAELKKRTLPCSTTEDSLSLATHPYCTECGVRLGAPDNAEEVEAAIADIATMLRSASIKFSRIAADRALSGEREQELKKLIQINSIADLTAVADILDPNVLKFLEQFADDQPGESGQ
ncbi:MAG: hypothetical protein O2788_00975 [Chloroflexi bacterium]|nr:hypothetical protein [Chloroflexota bacterium]